MNTATYSFRSEIPPVTNLKLKIEINTREHFAVMGYTKLEHSLKNGWFSGNCKMNSFTIEELLATKLRALFQRRKGRDLFDLYYALSNLEVDADKLIGVYKGYMDPSRGKSPTQREFIANLEEKIEDPDFNGDIHALLRPGVHYNQTIGFDLIREKLLERL